MNWLNTDFVKCDKTENKSLVVTLEPHWSPAVSQEAYDVKLPYCPNINEIIFRKDNYDEVRIYPDSGPFVFRRYIFIKHLYLNLETLFHADNISFDLPSNDDIIMNYMPEIILVSPIKHKEFRIPYNVMIPKVSFQDFIISIWCICRRHGTLFSDCKCILQYFTSQEVEEVVKLQSEILSNFSEEEIKAMDMETSPLYIPIAYEFIHNNFESFIRLIRLTNNKETLNRMLTDERSARELSGEAKAIIINRMAELDDERSFEL